MTTTPQMEPSAGSAAIGDTAFFESERLCYVSAAALTERIANAAWTCVEGQRVIVAGEDVLVDFANLQAAIVTLGALEDEYRAVANAGESLASFRSRRGATVDAEIEDEGLESFESMMSIAAPAIAAAFTPVVSGVSAALGMVNLFRREVEFRGIRTVVDPLSFELVLAQQLRRVARAVEVFVPELIVVTQHVAKDSLRARLQAVYAAKARAWAAAGPLISELVALDTELDRAARRDDAPAVTTLSAAVAHMRRELQPVSEPLGRADQRLSELEAAWAARDEHSGLTQLARLLRAEAIQDMKAVLVHAKIVSSGGHTRTTRSLLRTLFVGDGVTASGGAVARWAVLASTGAVLLAGLEHERRESDVVSRGWWRSRPPR